MTIKSRLNIVALLSVATVVVLFGFLLYTTWQISDELNQIDRVNQFAKRASELNIITEQFLAYEEQRYYEKWNTLYEDLQEKKSKIEKFPTRRVVTNALPSIKQSFALIQEVYNNPSVYQDQPEKRERLLERATARIRSDIQLLLAESQKLEQSRLQEVRTLQVYQRLQFLLILIPGIGFVVYMIFRIRKQLLASLGKLLEGTKSIANGNLDDKITVGGFEEHNELAQAFNEMTEKLQEHIKEEQKIRKKAEQNLKLWETLVDQDPSMVLIHIEGEVQFINEGGAKMMGVDSADNLIGESVFDYIDQAQKSQAIDRIRRIEEEKEQIAPEVYVIKRLDGENRYVQFESVPIVYNGKNATQTVGVDITEHINYEEQLQETLEEKSVLLQEIHHRVKNNLAIISGMMQLQAMESESKSLSNKLQESQLRIQSMASVHELLYDSESFTELNFTNQIEKLVATINDTLRIDTEVDINYELEDAILNVNQAIPTALIVNELVTNAFKHAFEQRDKGTINIILKTNQQELSLTIADNGVGLPDDFDIHQPSTLGMRIIQTLCGQLDATIEYQRENGSKFIIQFEMAEVKGIGS
ncbi:PAS domain S-box-containing protein [Fodinibius salinus]|uniref:histidine kinase n=1 Tax=Fodinibius salinus TaxID=860790 RepID=A0A5D3YLX1_9BACT|nr:histidine kinase dimerization/phosphoacceptor domain -containing protein [Fodinibius salinus]TYP94890.1 PAS domain S-box-containing protein [Fodinibius salinus]